MANAKQQREILSSGSKGGKKHSNFSSPQPPLVLNGFSSRPPRTRTSHACDHCRETRAKCSGGEICIKCRKDDVECVYSDRKRERNKKELAESVDRIDILQNDNQVLADAVRRFFASSDSQLDGDAELLELVAQYPTRVGGSSGRHSEDKAQWDAMQIDTAVDPTLDSEHFGENIAPSTISSPGNFGEITKIVDLDSGIGVSGFVGKMSEMSWIERVRQYVSSSTAPKFDSLDDNPIADGFGHNDFGYFADDADVLAVDEDHVDTNVWPGDNMSWILTEAFFHSLQGAFELVEREEFLNNLASYERGKPVPSWAERRWLATANLMWAVGARWMELIQLNGPNQESHLTYYARSRALGLDHRILFDHPDLNRISAVGILAFYLLVNGMVTRAWTILGHAIRHATAMGLHLKLSDPSVPTSEQQKRARIWYSLYSLEVLLSEITGRPKCIAMLDVSPSLLDISTPEVAAEGGPSRVDPSETEKMWLNFLNQNNRGYAQARGGEITPWASSSVVGSGTEKTQFSHFLNRMRLCQLSDQVAQRLYRPGTDTQSWVETQLVIDQLQTDLAVWLQQLPDELDIASKTSSPTDSRAKIELAMYYHSVQMILYRRCLCEIRIENESARSKKFNLTCGAACVYAAKNLLWVMPDNPMSNEIFQLLPWWSVLHYICQATAVLLIELCIDCLHFPSEAHEIAIAVRRAMEYLLCMTESSSSAYKAWRILRRLVADVVQKYDDDLGLDELPMHAVVPRTWTDHDEAILMGTSNVFPG